jgi:CheY-like chemotaxis protein
LLRDHETVQAASGAEAKEIRQMDQDFDVILCDIMMPDVSGMALHQWLLEASPRLAENLIFMTGGAFTPSAREYLNKVDNLRLEKPIDATNLRKIVNDRILVAKTVDSL